MSAVFGPSIIQNLRDDRLLHLRRAKYQFGQLDLLLPALLKIHQALLRQQFQTLRTDFPIRPLFFGEDPKHNFFQDVHNAAEESIDQAE